MSVTKVSNDNILSMSAAKLTGAMPALDGSALTGIVAGSEAMTGAGDPENETNPADGVGALWINTTTGEMFICVDATTNGNVWNNVGEGSGHITYVPPPWTYTASVAAYTSGGGWYPMNNAVDKFLFSPSNAASAVGTLSEARGFGSGQSSSTHGYISGGTTIGGTSGSYSSKVDQFSFVSEGAASHIFSLTTATEGGTGNSSETDGYISGGTSTSAYTDKIEKFSFSSNNSSSIIGTLTLARNYASHSGQSSTSYGYTSGGQLPGNSWQDRRDKFSFVSNGNATTVGNLTAAKASSHGQNSTTHGYVTGGYNGSNFETIEKFDFSSDGTSSLYGGVLTLARRNAVGQSSTTHGYTSSGFSNAGASDVVDKFNFSSEGDAVTASQLSIARQGVMASQY